MHNKIIYIKQTCCSRSYDESGFKNNIIHLQKWMKKVCHLTGIRWIYIWNINGMRCDQKVSRLKLYLPKQKWTMNETFIFFKIVLFTFNTFIPVSSPFKEAHLKFLFWYVVQLFHHIYFDTLHILKFYPWEEFSVHEMKKSLRARFGILSQPLCH